MNRETWKDLIDSISKMNILTIENAKVAKLIYKAYLQYQHGVISEIQLRWVPAPLNLSEPRIQAFWESDQGNFADGYRDYINSKVVEINSGS